MRTRTAALSSFAAALVLAALPACSTFTSTRSRVLEERFVEAPGALVSSVPVLDELHPIGVESAGLEGGAAPALLARVAARRTLTYEAEVLRTPVRSVRQARATYVNFEWPHEVFLRAPPLLAILFFPIGLVVDVYWAIRCPALAFSYAGDGLEEGEHEARDAMAGTQGEACFVAVAEAQETGPPERTEKRERVERTLRAALPGVEIAARFEGGAGAVVAVADAEGTARLPIAGLAAILPREGAPVLVLQSGPFTAALPLADPVQRPLVAALVRETLRGPAPALGEAPAPRPAAARPLGAALSSLARSVRATGSGDIEPVCAYCGAHVERGEAHRRGCPYYSGGGGDEGGGEERGPSQWEQAAEQALEQHRAAWQANMATTREELAAWQGEVRSGAAPAPNEADAWTALRASVDALEPPPLAGASIPAPMLAWHAVAAPAPAPAAASTSPDPLAAAARRGLATGPATPPLERALAPLGAGGRGLRIVEPPPLETWPAPPPPETREGELAAAARDVAHPALAGATWVIREGKAALVEAVETKLVDGLPVSVRRVLAADRAVLEGTEDVLSRSDAIVVALVHGSPEACLRLSEEVEGSRRATVERVDAALGTSWRRLEAPAESVQADIESATGLGRIATLRRALGGDGDAWRSMVKEALSEGASGAVDRATGGGGE